MTELLTPDELAALFKLKRRTVMDKITRHPEFPRSVTGNQKPRWLQLVKKLAQQKEKKK